MEIALLFSVVLVVIVGLMLLTYLVRRRHHEEQDELYNNCDCALFKVRIEPPEALKGRAMLWIDQEVYLGPQSTEKARKNKADLLRMLAVSASSLVDIYDLRDPNVRIVFASDEFGEIHFGLDQDFWPAVIDVSQVTN